MVGFAACSPEMPQAPPHYYLVQYKYPINGADSAVIGYLGGAVVLSIPAVNSVVFQSQSELTVFESIPDKWTVDTVSGPEMAVLVAVTLKADATPDDVAAVNALATGRRPAQPYPTSPRLLETWFRLSAISQLAALSTIGSVGLEYPGSSQAGVVGRQ